MRGTNWKGEIKRRKGKQCATGHAWVGRTRSEREGKEEWDLASHFVDRLNKSIKARWSTLIELHKWDLQGGVWGGGAHTHGKAATKQRPGWADHGFRHFLKLIIHAGPSSCFFYPPHLSFCFSVCLSPPVSLPTLDGFVLPLSVSLSFLSFAPSIDETFSFHPFVPLSFHISRCPWPFPLSDLPPPKLNLYICLSVLTFYKMYDIGYIRCFCYRNCNENFCLFWHLIDKWPCFWDKSKSFKVLERNCWNFNKPGTKFPLWTASVQLYLSQNLSWPSKTPICCTVPWQSPLLSHLGTSTLLMRPPCGLQCC